LIKSSAMQESDRNMGEFLKSIERRAFRMAEIASGDKEEALDIVQDAMFRFVDKYGGSDESEWRPLFYRILQNRIRDWYRRKAVRDRLRVWLDRWKGEEEETKIDPLQSLQDPTRNDPEKSTESSDALAALDAALHSLPLRQQQAFLLRAWEEMSVKETSKIMNCSEGSVKTHYSRAVRNLREKLEGWWP